MRVLRQLLQFTQPLAGWIFLSVVLGFATIGSSIGLMATSAYIISAAALHPSIAVLQVSIVGVRFFGLSRGVFRYLERYVSHQTTFRLLARLRVWFYTALEPLAPARLAHYHSGDLLARITADIQSLEDFFVRALAPPLTAGLVILLTGGLLAFFSPMAALITVGFLILGGLGVPLLTQLLGRETGRQTAQTRAALSVSLIDGVQGLADLLAAGQEKARREEIGGLSRMLINLQNKTAQITGLNAALIGLLANWSVIAVLVITVPLVNQGRLDGVYLAVLALAANAGFEAVAPLPDAAWFLRRNLASARRLFEVVNVPPPVLDPPEPVGPPQTFSLSVENLSFSYGVNEPPVLRDLSFCVPEGGKLAVVGPSGAGKSTLVNLLLRFWEYQSGSIRLGAADLRRYRLEDVRAALAVVSQRTVLFSGTIMENLLLARPSATADEVMEAARLAQIHPFIQSLPEGYHTWVGEQGLQLSGGERQRLAIARALLKNAPILILDEATANLDPLVEREVIQAIHTLMRGRTTLMITHRLTGLEAMDEILVLRSGQVAERGVHGQLLAAGGLYRQLWEAQRQADLA